MYEKIYGTINGKKFAGIKKTDYTYLFFYNGFWFSAIPDIIEERKEDIYIDRNYIFNNNNIKLQ